MAYGAPLPVREYANADEMRRHAAELRARMFAPRPEPIARGPVVRVIAAGRDKYRASSTSPIVQAPAPVQSVPIRKIVAAAPTTLPATAGQRERGAVLRGTDCMRVVSQVTGIPQAHIVGPSRKQIVVKARQLAAWLLVNRGGKSLPEAGRILGERDHTTILHACRRVDAVTLPVSAQSGDVVLLVAAIWDATRPEPYLRAR